MLTLPDLIKICIKYNITSNNYGPTIYKNNNKIGLCLDIKDKTFGYLTRVFTFQSKKECEDFLNKYKWYQTNKNKYNIKITLDSYESKEPILNYTFNQKNLTFSDMLNINNLLNTELEIEKKTTEENLYRSNIKNLTNYLDKFKANKIETKKRKNDLKIKENDLKYELLKELTTYYGSEKIPFKKNVSLELINDILPSSTDITNIKNLEVYLKKLINEIKEEELEEQYLVDLYSISVYEYNIIILKKQIEFVKNKITAEKNFNLKGSKIHNIDAELKSFLKNGNGLLSIEDFLKINQKKIEDKYALITDIKDAYKIISGNNLNKYDIINTKTTLIDTYTNLNSNIKNALILYNSFYKDICNYIIDNNYPNIEEIIKNCEISKNYNKFQKIIYNENNNHYSLNYFKNISFNNITTYTASLINLCKIIEQNKLRTKSPLKAFSLNLDHKYKSYSLDPSYNKNEAYIIEIPINTEVIYIPEKLILDEETEEINKISSSNIYLKDFIIKTNNEIKINIYEKVNEKNKKYNITITKNLNLKDTIIYKIGYIEEILT